MIGTANAFEEKFQQIYLLFLFLKSFCVTYTKANFIPTENFVGERTDPPYAGTGVHPRLTNLIKKILIKKKLI